MRTLWRGRAENTISYVPSTRVRVRLPSEGTSLSRSSLALCETRTQVQPRPLPSIAASLNFVLVAQAFLPVHLFARLNERSAHHAREKSALNNAGAAKPGTYVELFRPREAAKIRARARSAFWQSTTCASQAIPKPEFAGANGKDHSTGRVFQVFT